VSPCVQLPVSSCPWDAEPRVALLIREQVHEGEEAAAQLQLRLHTSQGHLVLLRGLGAQGTHSRASSSCRDPAGDALHGPASQQ
jgi:hypothetical protein